MFEKTIKNLANKIERKERVKKFKEDEKAQNKEKVEVYKQLRNLYQFVRWLEKYSFRNRHERKGFWRAVMTNTNVMEDTILSMSEKYKGKDDKEYNAPLETKKEKK